MEQSLFAFIWKHSKRDQFILLAVTVLSFPLLYATLELPKRIINDAIGATEPVLSLFGMEVTQLQYLGVLCFGFLLAVIASGLMKMRVNTMKGILSERLLRRFRFTLIERILRFPKPQFRRTSQGALISMVTSEAEPLGGVMGDAVAQPVFQAGQMLTILTFLFVQSPWLGLAAVALIPLQAWLIPLLQRRINLLNKARVQEVRRLAERIGESVEGVGDLRANGALRFTLADMTTRLGTLFDIRYRIYRQKFFMKFLNNFITQLTPFFFFSIGGYLAITGDLTVGALVAALAAYKDLSGPWKELLTYYNQVQDMSLRYNTIVEQFAPRGLLEAELVNGEPAELPRLTGPIELHNVSVREPDGSLLLEDISARIPAGSSVAIEAPNASERRAFAELIAREVSPASGRVTIAGSDLAGLHQSVLATRIGYAAARPQMFRGTIRDNVLMGLRIAPNGAAEASAAALEEARRTGNSTDDASCDWTDLGRIGLREADELRDWWLKLVEAMGTDGFLFDRGMDRRFDPEEHPELARRLVALRPRIAERIAEAGYEIGFHAFDREAFNPGLPVGGNLLFAIPRREISSDEMAANPRLLPAFRALGLEEKLLFLGAEIIAVLTRTFGEVGTDHPLFVRLGMDAAFFKQLVEIEAKRREIGLDRLDERMRSLLMTVPFRLSAEQIGTGFPEALRSKILDLRRTRGEALRREAVDVFAPLEPDSYVEGLSVLENVIWGKVALGAGNCAHKLRALVAEVLIAEGLKGEIAQLIYDVAIDIGGAGLSPVAQERMGFVRAAIKKPDILVLDNALASHSSEARQATRTKLRALLPETTLIYLEERFRNPADYDVHLAIENGRLAGAEDDDAASSDPSMNADLDRKMRALAATSLFHELDSKQLRLLAFASQWFKVREGTPIFEQGDIADAAYLITQGHALLRWPDMRDPEAAIASVEPGRLIGDLSVITGTRRSLELVAETEVKGLRIGSEELLEIITTDPVVSMSLLRTVSGYLGQLGGRLHDLRARIHGDDVDYPPTLQQMNETVAKEAAAARAE